MFNQTYGVLQNLNGHAMPETKRIIWKLKQLKVGLHKKSMNKRKFFILRRNIPERIPIDRRHSPTMFYTSLHYLIKNN